MKLRVLVTTLFLCLATLAPHEAYCMQNITPRTEVTNLDALKAIAIFAGAMYVACLAVDTGIQIFGWFLEGPRRRRERNVGRSEPEQTVPEPLQARQDIPAG